MYNATTEAQRKTRSMSPRMATRSSLTPAYPCGGPLRYVRVVAKLREWRGRTSLNIEDIRPVSHPFEAYAHQFGCMYDSMLHWKTSGVKPDNSNAPTELEPAVASKAEETKPTMAESQPAGIPSRSSSSGMSSFVSVNEDHIGSDSTESFDMVDESTSAGDALIDSALTEPPPPEPAPTEPDFGSVVSRLSLADEPYPDPAYSISQNMAANVAVKGRARADKSSTSPHRSESGAVPVTPVHSPARVRTTPQRASNATNKEAGSPRSPLTPIADKSRRRSKGHRHSAARSPEPLAELTTDQRNIILCIQQAYIETPRSEAWLGVDHFDIAMYVTSKKASAERSILAFRDDLDILIQKGYIETTVDEDHFDCRDRGFGRYQIMTERVQEQWYRFRCRLDPVSPTVEGEESAQAYPKT
ncbi:hypothetical protein HDZ31DRAFT_74135 [Schizophyllum fasciatum]